MSTSDTSRLRSARWFGPRDLTGVVHRTAIKSEGISQHSLDGRPVVGICNSWSELVNCNLHFRGLAAAVKRGVLQAGGLPLEFPTMSLGESLMKPSAMLYRNLMAMDVEESIRSYPLDAIVLLGGCDKTVPSQLMGAASADVPAIMVTGGPMMPAVFRGRELGVGTDTWHYAQELRAGRMTEEEFAELEAAAKPGYGHCNEMGTASTMTSIVEALGMCLPGTSSIPAADSNHVRMCSAVGRRIVEMVWEDLTPTKIMTKAAFKNAIVVAMAMGCSTNAVIHLVAMARRAGHDIRLEDFDEASRRVPVIANIRPSGSEYLMEDFYYAGGLIGLMSRLKGLLDLTPQPPAAIEAFSNCHCAPCLAAGWSGNPARCRRGHPRGGWAGP